MAPKSSCVRLWLGATPSVELGRTSFYSAWNISNCSQLNECVDALLNLRCLKTQHAYVMGQQMELFEQLSACMVKET
jgi:hypothetical protein